VARLTQYGSPTTPNAAGVITILDKNGLTGSGLGSGRLDRRSAERASRKQTATVYKPIKLEADKAVETGSRSSRRDDHR